MTPQVLEPETLTLEMPLTNEERGELTRCEEVIDRGLPTVFEVGKAFKIIIDRKLYRETHRTAEDYFRERWQLSRPRAYQLIDGATVRENIAEHASTNGRQHIPLPNNERQTRALKKVSADKQGDIWEQAVTQNNGKPPTAKQVQQVVEQEQAPKKPMARPGELDTVISGFIAVHVTHESSLDEKIETLQGLLYGFKKSSRELYDALLAHIGQLFEDTHPYDIRIAAEAVLERWETLRESRQKAQVEQEQARLRQVHEDLGLIDNRHEVQQDEDASEQLYTARYWKIKIPDDIEVGESGELFAHSRHGERFKREAADDEKAELRAGYWRRHPEKKPADAEPKPRCAFCEKEFEPEFLYTRDEAAICYDCAYFAYNTLGKIQWKRHIKG